MSASITRLEKDLFKVSEVSFKERALTMFAFQHEHNKMYRSFCDALRTVPAEVTQLDHIPFLPIQFFKTANICTGDFVPQKIFESSGTTGSVNSRHEVKDISIYERSFNSAFKLFYGDIQNYCVLGLLPSYLEREHSSLVYMVRKLIEQSGNVRSGFYLYDLEKLRETILVNEKNKIQTLLIGVTYALLDFAAGFNVPLKYCIVMETGGMKGKREELTRAEVHRQLCAAWKLPQIHSEYGMTELLSQAYSRGDGIFICPPWMKAVLRAEDDPFDIYLAPTENKSYAAGVLNIIDLANIYSCAFIATDDIGKLYDDGTFEVLGRLDNSDLRGCGLMIL